MLAQAFPRTSTSHLSVLPSGGTADSRRHHPGRDDPQDSPSSEARGRPATDCPGSCSPSNVRLGRLSPCHRAWTQERRARSGGMSHPAARLQSRLKSAPSSRPTSPVPRLSPQGTPEALPYPILRRLSSTSESCATPRSAWLGAAPAGRPQRAGGTAGRRAKAV